MARGPSPAAPLNERTLRFSAERIEKAWEGLRKHVLMGPLVTRAKLRIIDYQPQVPAMFTLVSPGGDVFANPYNHPRTIGEWTFVLAHSLMHLAFGHLKHVGRGMPWNLACDCIVNEFLQRMRIGTAPEGLLRLPPGLPNDEEKLWQLFTQGTKPPSGQTTNGAALDMTTGPAKGNWADTFARAVRRAARKSLADAAQDDAELAPPQLARAWFVKNYPLLGAVLQQLRLVEDARLCERLGIRIGALNPGRREIILNPGWALSDAEYRYVLAHLALHAGLRHGPRCRQRDPFLWNVACDYAVNGWLAQIPFLQRHIKAPAEGVLLSAVYSGQRPETIYPALQDDEKNVRKLVTLASEGQCDLLGVGAADEARAIERTSEEDVRSSARLLVDALLRGYQIHTESGKGALPHGLLEEIRSLEHPPLPWDVQLARWFDEHIPPLERIRTYARPSRRQSATPNIARPRYLWPDDENAQRSTFGLIIDASGRLERHFLASTLGAISAYALSRNIGRVRVILAGAEFMDRGMISADELAAPFRPLERTSATLQPAVKVLEEARDFPGESPILLLTSLPCDRVTTARDHAFLIPDGGRLTWKSAAPVIEVAL